MSKKAELFQEYLTSHNLTMFTRQDLNDQLKTSVFRSAFSVAGETIPFIIVVDESAFCMLQVQIAGGVVNDGNRARIYEEVNKWNITLKPFKYVIDTDGSLILTCCMMNADGQMDGDKTNAMMNIILDYLTKEYRNILAVVKG
jgi:hypothetical protein